MASRTGLFILCLQMALVGLTACGPSMSTPDIHVPNPDSFENEGDLKKDFIDTFMVTDREFGVMVTPETTPYAVSAQLTLTTEDQYILNVEWTTGKRETFSGPFARVYDSEVSVDFEFDNGQMMIVQNDDSEIECIDMAFDKGALRSLRFLLCDGAL